MGEMKHLETLDSQWVGFTALGFVNVLLQSPKLRILKVSGESLAGLSEVVAELKPDLIGKISKNLVITVNEQYMSAIDLASLKTITNRVKYFPKICR